MSLNDGEDMLSYSLEILVPCYNEEDCVELFFDRVNEVLTDQLSWSIIYINDGSQDKTLEKIQALVEKHGSEKVKYISFSRNFGKESAIYAGLLYSTADLVVLMDADLQHPPELIPEMIQGIEEGYDVCAARRVNRKGEGKVRSLFSKTFYKSFSKSTGTKLVQGGSDFRMMRRNVVDAMLSLTERERFSKGIWSWVGFNTKWIEYENVERAAGKTKWSFMGLFRYAVTGYFDFAVAPLRAAIWLGFIIDIITVVFGIKFIIDAFGSGGPRTGFSTIVILVAFFGGTIILLLGVIGEYLSRIYIETKRRPIFIVKDTNIK